MSLAVKSINSTTATVIEGVKSFEKAHITNTGSVDAVFTLQYTGSRDIASTLYEAPPTVETITANIIKSVTIPVGVSLELEGFTVTSILDASVTEQDYTVAYTNISLQAFIGTEGQTVDLLIQLSYDE